MSKGWACLTGSPLFKKIMAALSTSCLDGVVGLANCACPCLTDSAPEGYNEASSGLFINDILPLEMLDSADDCNDPENPWSIYERGLAEGKNMLIKDINAGLMARNQLSKKAFKGIIGEKKSRELVTLTKAYAGVRIWSPTTRGAYIKSIRIGGVFDTVGSVVVKVYDQFNVQHGANVTLTTTAGGHVSAAFATDLPLWQDGAADCQYFLVYEVDGAPVPRAIRPWCPPCSNKTLPTFYKETPYTTQNWTRDQAWASWLMVGGYQADNLTDFDLISETSEATSFTNGLTIECELSCDPFTSVCMDELDYSDPVSLSAAHALRYAAAICAAEKIIRSTNPQRNATVSREILAVDIQQWWKDYEKNVNYVTYHANVKGSDCIFCKPTFSMSIQSKTP